MDDNHLHFNVLPNKKKPGSEPKIKKERERERGGGRERERERERERARGRERARVWTVPECLFARMY